MTWPRVLYQNSLILSNFFLLIYCVFLTNATMICDFSKKVEARMWGGESANCEDFPYVVFIGKIGNTNYTCVGSIIHKEWVLTSARCVVGNNRTELYVISGSNLFTPQDLRHFVVTVIAHPDFDHPNFTNNLAMMQVYPPFVYDESTQPIAIGVPSEGEEAVTMGWGENEKDKISNGLRSLKLKIISDAECQTKTNNIFDKLPGEMCCLGKGKPCDGDWGAPLVLKGKLVGMFSYRVDRCPGQLKPVVFVKVEYYRSWIEEILKKCECSNNLKCTK